MKLKPLVSEGQLQALEEVIAQRTQLRFSTIWWTMLLVGSDPKPVLTDMGTERVYPVDFGQLPVVKLETGPDFDMIRDYYKKGIATATVSGVVSPTITAIAPTDAATPTATATAEPPVVTSEAPVPTATAAPSQEPVPVPEPTSVAPPPSATDAPADPAPSP
jgi:hypothetical protein